MRVYMRNKASGEIREVEADSGEFRDLAGQVTSLGQPMWEQTSFPHADAIKGRAKYGELNEEDLGYEDADELRPAALALDAQGVAPEANPHLALTPGEIEQGLTPEQKRDDLQSQYESDVLARRGNIFGRAADRIADEREERQPDGSGVLSARAGGSDDRDDAPAVGSTASGAGQSPAPRRAPSPAGSSSGSSGSSKDGE